MPSSRGVDSLDRRSFDDNGGISQRPAASVENAIGVDYGNRRLREQTLRKENSAAEEHESSHGRGYLRFTSI
jgi:hypothetical protein